MFTIFVSKVDESGPSVLRRLDLSNLKLMKMI